MRLETTRTALTFLSVRSSWSPADLRLGLGSFRARILFQFLRRAYAGGISYAGLSSTGVERRRTLTHKHGGEPIAK